MPDTGETHFGFQTVDLAHKQDMVDEVFQRVARRYDLMNDLMSGGLHRFWKDAMVAMLNPPRRGRYWRSPASRASSRRRWPACWRSARCPSS